MKISGSGTIPAGEYNQKISISGGGRIDGNIRCSEFSCSGSAKGTGNIECLGDVSVAGAMTLDGSLLGENIEISGSGKIEESCTAKKELRVCGSFKGKSLKATTIKSSGGVNVKEGIECEKIRVNGGIVCGGLLNAESIEIVLDVNSTCSIGSIGGSDIKIYPKYSTMHTKGSRMPLLEKIIGRRSIMKHEAATISESIEGDVIAIENVKTPLVIGRVVAIGCGCEIGLVQYSEAIEIDPEAKVEKTEKI